MPFAFIESVLQVISDNVPIQTTLTTNFMFTSTFTAMLREVSMLWESSFSVLPGSIWMNYLMTFLLKKSHDVEHFLTVNFFTYMTKIPPFGELQLMDFWYMETDCL